ncbi:MAG: 50S ribosomal protein L29 [Candidatus Krumholzibacteria bacterium]
MKPHEMREMAEDELQHHHDGLMDELVNLKIKLAVKQLDNPLSVKSLKREIARAKTVLRDKKLGAKPGQTLSEKK